MDCNNARLLLQLLSPVPGELDADEAAALRDHLCHCPDCGPLAVSEQRFDRALGKAMRAVPIPDGLRTRLLTRLDRDRDAWYRRFVTRRVLPIAGAAAAVVLLGLLLGLNWGKLRPSRIDADVVLNTVNHDYQATEDQVNQWLRGVSGGTLESDPRFDYYRLERYFLSDLQGQTVPTLFFVAPENQLKPEGKSVRAWVYVLSKSRFNLVNFDAPQIGGSDSNFKVRRLKHPTNDNVEFVAVYTGDSFDPFFTRDDNPHKG